MIKNAEFNHKNIYDIPMFINSNNKMYCIEGTSYGTLGIIGGIITEFEGQYNQYVHYVAPDKRPENGEYWTSRGISDGLDVSGFVKSKLAGERLLRMVKYVLENDKPKSWLDYRESEPNWIQFKFQKEEFDLEKLDSMVKENNHIITIDILKQCKL